MPAPLKKTCSGSQRPRAAGGNAMPRAKQASIRVLFPSFCRKVAPSARGTIHTSANTKTRMCGYGATGRLRAPCENELSAPPSASSDKEEEHGCAQSRRRGEKEPPGPIAPRLEDLRRRW